MDVVHVIWCNSCQSEEALQTIEFEIDGEWIAFDLGEKCLTMLREAGKIE